MPKITGQSKVRSPGTVPAPCCRSSACLWRGDTGLAPWSISSLLLREPNFSSRAITTKLRTQEYEEQNGSRKLKKDNGDKEKRCLLVGVEGTQNEFAHGRHWLPEWKQEEMLDLADQAREGSQSSRGGPGPAVPPSSPQVPTRLPQLCLCLLGFALPARPSPSLLLSLPYHGLLVLWTSSPLHPEVSGSPSAARAAPARAAGPASAAEQLRSRLQRWSTSSPGSSRMHKQTNYATDPELRSKRKWPLDVIA